MERRTGPTTDRPSREARSKSALKANLARRKAQARARAASDTEGDDVADEGGVTTGTDRSLGQTTSKE